MHKLIESVSSVKDNSLLFDKPILKADEVARFLQCSVGHVYNLVNQRRIPFRKFGRMLRFIRSDILEWVQSGE